MSAWGLVRFYSVSGKQLNELHYGSVAERRTLINDFEEAVGEGEYYYHILPGFCYRNRTSVPVPPKTIMIRPTTEYTNLKSYEYK